MLLEMIRMLHACVIWLIDTHYFSKTDKKTYSKQRVG